MHGATSAVSVIRGGNVDGPRFGVPEVQARLFQAWLLERMVRESRRAAATSAAEARRLTHVEARSYIFALGDRRGRLPLAAVSSLWKSPFSRRR